ncbi:MAG: fluoride efflux transporter FluC [Acidimicrobiales bacterium]
MPRIRSGIGAVPEVPRRILAIAVGGSLGTLARYGIEQAFAPPAFGFPWPTLVANTTGSLLLGGIITLMVERWPPTRFVRPFAAIGFCGGFTTFSTMVVEAAQLGRHGRAGLAGLYLVATLGAGLLAAALGIWLARWKLPAVGRRPIPDPDDLGALQVEPGPRPGAPPDPLGALIGETGDTVGGSEPS